jgi:uncharacterized protein
MASTATRLEERIAALDVLRGFALFGVLVVNLHFWFRTTPARYDLALHPWPSLLDRATDDAVGLFFSNKFISLFSLLFGVGLAMQRERALAHGRAFWPFALRRLGMLACIGGLHVLLLWMGDILIAYALLGLLLLPLLGVKTRTLVICTSVLMSLPLIVTSIGLAVSTTTLQAPTADTLAQTLKSIEQSVHVYRHGTWIEISRYRLQEYRDLVPLLARMSVLMLAAFVVGVLGYRQGCFMAASERRCRLQWLATFGSSVGLTLGAAALLVQTAPTLEPTALSVLVDALQPPAALLQAAGYAAAIRLLLDRPHWHARLSAIFAPLGRMALSNYLAQSILCGALFYSWGFGLYDKLSPSQGVMVGCAIYVVQVLGSRCWLAHFAQGPVEWLWRRTSYVRTAYPSSALSTRRRS